MLAKVPIRSPSHSKLGPHWVPILNKIGSPWHLGAVYVAKYTHIEAEFPFIDFEELLSRLKNMVCDVVDRVLKSPFRSLVHELYSDFKLPKMPFRRMKYTEAIQMAEGQRQLL